MTIRELEKVAIKAGLRKVANYQRKYKTGGTYFLDEVRIDIYGIFRTSEGSFIAFYDCIERGKMNELGEVKTVSEACELLSKAIKEAYK